MLLNTALRQRSRWELAMRALGLTPAPGTQSWMKVDSTGLMLVARDEESVTMSFTPKSPPIPSDAVVRALEARAKDMEVRTDSIGFVFPWLSSGVDVTGMPGIKGGREIVYVSLQDGSWTQTVAVLLWQ